MRKFFLVATLSALSALLALSCSGHGGENPKATCAADLEGQSVGCLAGSVCDLHFDEFVHGADKQIYNTEPDLFVAQDNRRIDFILVDSVMVVGVDRSEHSFEPAFNIPEMGGDIGVAFRKSDKELCAQCNAYLAEIRANGTYDDIIDRWFTDKARTSVIPEFEQYSEGEPLKVGVMIGFPLCFVKDGKWAGLDVELMMRFASWLHRPVEIVPLDFSALMVALKTGVIDVWCAFVTINEERAKEVLFSDPYCFSPASVFQRRDDWKVESVPFTQKIADSFRNNLIAEERWRMLVDGIWETLVISLLSLLLGTLLGGAICALRMSRHKLLQGFAKVYVEILRGVPMLVFLMVMFYVVLAPAGMSGRWVAVISFAINFSAYVSEIFRTGIEAVDKGQREAGLAMGFTPLATFLYFIVPQAAKNVLPVFKNEAVSLIKGTSIVGYVAIQDLTKMSDIIRSRTFDAFFPLILVSIIYFILAWLLGKALDILSKKIA